MLEVVLAGLHDTIQDAGRPDAADLGVTRSGACDPLALAAANLLVGDGTDLAVLEMTLSGPALLAREPCLVALTGADLGARVEAVSGAVTHAPRPGESFRLMAGERLVLGAARDGARGYLAVAGGIGAPRILGSASTAPVGGFGGLDGRPLMAGDVLRAGAVDRAGPALGPRRWPGPGPCSGIAPHLVGPRVVRVVLGPHASAFPAGALDVLLGETWTISVHSDRMGARLVGPPMPAAEGPDPPSLGMVWGAVEVPPDGAPIILLADHPTVGGYRVPLVVISADRPALGQLRPDDEVRFVPVDLAQARDLAMRSAGALQTAAARLIGAS